MSEVVLSSETIDTFKRAYDINQSLKIVKDQTEIHTKSENNCVAMKATIAEKFPRDVCIYDMREFISVLGIIEEPVVDFSNEKLLTIKSKDGSQKIRYYETPPTLISSYFENPPKLPTVDVEVKVTDAQFKSVLRAAATMKLEYVGFSSDGEKLYFNAFNKNDGDDKDTNKYSIEVGTSDEKFNMFYSMSKQNLRVLENKGDCTFKISSKKVSKVDVSAGNGKEFWITMDVKSKFGE